VVKPADGVVTGTVYTDGSRLDQALGIPRNGWAFVAVDAHGTVTASAFGLPPDWITDIPGTEAWALLQAALVSLPGTQYRVDCEVVVRAVRAGVGWATCAKRPLARVFALLLAALDDAAADAVVWMPAHCTARDVGVKVKGNNEGLTAIDLGSNDKADALAKKAVEEHRVPRELRRMLKRYSALVEATLRWLGTTTYEATHSSDPPYRDSVASGAAAAMVRAKRRGQKRRRRGLASLSPGLSCSAGTS
jgi:hypothetical protein